MLRESLTRMRLSKQTISHQKFHSVTQISISVNRNSIQSVKAFQSTEIPFSHSKHFSQQKFHSVTQSIQKFHPVTQISIPVNRNSIQSVKAFQSTDMSSSYSKSSQQKFHSVSESPVNRNLIQLLKAFKSTEISFSHSKQSSQQKFHLVTQSSHHLNHHFHFCTESEESQYIEYVVRVNEMW